MNLKSVSATEVLQALPAKQGLFDSGERYAFAIDGWVLADAPRALVAKGQLNKVPVMLGTTGDENTIFSSELQINTAVKYAFLLSQYFGSNASAVEKRYPAASFDTPKAAFDSVMTDAIFTCPSRGTARDLVKSGAPVFRYHFTWVTELGKLTKLGAFHSSEIEFVFGSLSARKTFPATPDEKSLSNTMSDYWSEFARNGDPGGDWKTFASGNERYIDFNVPVTAKTGLKDADCDFFDGLN